MKKLLVMVVSLFAVYAAAQVTTNPDPIEVGYTGQVTITFDPTKGDAGMKDATECYLYSCVEVDNSDNWEYQLAAWPSKSDKTKMTKSGNNWVLTIPNLYTFYGVPSGKTITKILVLFTDGVNNGKSGRGTGGQDIVITMGEKTVADIWDAVSGVAGITGTRPSGIDQGIYYGNDGTSVTLCTFAAGKKSASSSELVPANRVFLIGDMTDWKLSSNYQLKRDGNYFWITLTGLTPGKEYRFQYAVERADGVRKQICDLYSEKVLSQDDKWEPKKVDPSLIDYPQKGADGGFVTVIQTNKPAFNWSSATLNFQRPNKNNLVIYELWVYDYTPSRCLEGVRLRLDYLQQLGVNAIELMPVCEFDGNYNWGYSPCLYFALDKAYATPNQFKQFVDECHQRGIAVILDMVFNHATGNNPMNKLYPYGTDFSLNPWFNVTPPHGDNVYEDWNHDFGPAHNMFIRALQYWLTEYKVDGYRLDLSHGLCGPSYNAVTNLKDYYQKGVKDVSSDAYMICEHWGSNMGSDRPQLINEGMMCWNNTNNAYCQTAMGWLKDGDNLSDANQDNYVSYCESHDEQRMQYKCKKWGNGTISSSESTRLGRVAENVAMNVLLNGPHMIWQFEEIGYDFGINSDIDHPDADDESYRCSKKPRPEPLGYFSNPSRIEAYKKCAQAIQLRTRIMPNVFEGNPTASTLGSGVSVRSVQWGNNVYVVANFDASSSKSVTLPSGTWYDYYAGGTQASGSITLQAGEVKIYTGSKVTLPTINTDLEHMLPISNVESEEAPKAYKILRDGQVFILRGDKTYTITGMEVR